MESPPRLGLENINITPLCEGIRNPYPEFKYGDEKILGTQPYLTHGSASTHCVTYPNSIKGSFNKLFYTHVRAKPTLTCI